MGRKRKGNEGSGNDPHVINGLILPAPLMKQLMAEANRTGNSYVATIRFILDDWFAKEKAPS